MMMELVTAQSAVDAAAPARRSEVLVPVAVRDQPEKGTTKGMASSERLTQKVTVEKTNDPGQDRAEASLAVEAREDEARVTPRNVLPVEVLDERVDPGIATLLVEAIHPRAVEKVQRTTTTFKKLLLWPSGVASLLQQQSSKHKILHVRKQIQKHYFFQLESSCI